jgi:Reverse transcriptase (RNA-dependent DNA polymerase)
MSPPDNSNIIPPGKILRLRKSLYGLKQSGRLWNLKLKSALLEFGCVQSILDPGIFILKDKDNFMLLTSHFDDLIIAYKNPKTYSAFIKKLQTDFEYTDLRNLNYYLGIKIIRDFDNQTIFLSQTHTIKEILNDFNMTDCKPKYTPGINQLTKDMSPTTNEEKDEMKNKPYSTLVGKCMYLAVST